QSQIGYMKKYPVCQTSNIDNKKQVCPKCQNKLPTIAKIIDEQPKTINAAEKLPTISLYIFKQQLVLEANKPHICHGFTAKSHQFWVQIKKTQFVNPNADNRIFQNLDEELTLSKQMIRFNEIVSMKRNEFIKATLIKKIPLDIWCSIPIACDETELQGSKSFLKKPEILFIINSLITSLGDLDRSRFCSLSNKSRKDLINILQEVRNILAKNNISTSKK
ncbi:2885_t:CDS:2, partial [Dentiscutata heterogama]